MLEREMKFLVKKDRFYVLLEQAKQAYPDIQPKEIDQTNYYYDTEDLQLFKQHITLRVRRKNGKYAIEKKEVQSYEGQVRRATESKYPVAALPESINAAEVGLDGESVYHLLGQLDTHRIRFTLPDGTNIDFDVSKYFHAVDYEVEIELGENPPTSLIQEVSAYIKGNNAVGKLERFITALKHRKINPCPL